MLLNAGEDDEMVSTYYCDLLNVKRIYLSMT